MNQENKNKIYTAYSKKYPLLYAYGNTAVEAQEELREVEKECETWIKENRRGRM